MARTVEKVAEEFSLGTTMFSLTVTGVPFFKPIGNTRHWFIPMTCACGRTLNVSIPHLRKGSTKSCGCLRTQRIAALNRSHGASKHWLLKKLRAVHAGMLRRTKFDPTYAGITVCQEWQSCLNFMVWALENGYAPGRSINRKNNELGYSPTNCELTSDCANANNRSSSRLVTFGGQTRTLAEHCRTLKLHYPTVSTRLCSYGWTIEQALSKNTKKVKEYPLIYLGSRAQDAVLTVGKTESLTRFKALHREGFNIIGKYATASSTHMGFLEFMLHNWLDERGIKRGVAPKSKSSKRSPETFFCADAVTGKFKFRKLCTDLEQKIPEVLAELQIELERLRGIQQASIPASVPTSVPTCHQHIIREQTKLEDLARLIPTLGDLSNTKASQFDLANEPYAEYHRDFIKRYEWLGTPGISIKWCFAARYHGELGGVVLLSEPYHPSKLDALIARGACAGWTPKNLGSRLVMFACRWMVANTGKRQFTAYADEEAGEIGQIYQACNFKFLGWKAATYGIDESGQRKSFQTLKRTSRMVPWLKAQGIVLPESCFTSKGYLRWSALPINLKHRMRTHVAQERSKLRPVRLRRGCYLLALGQNKAETRQLNLQMKATMQPYPKRSSGAPECDSARNAQKARYNA